MRSIAFPTMVGGQKTFIYEDNQASSSNLKLLLLSDKMALIGDPYFGTNLKRFLYSQGDRLLRDLLIDDIYVAIVTFMPQIDIQRKGITLSIKNNQVFVSINCINKIDKTNNLYEINLTSG